MLGVSPSPAALVSAFALALVVLAASLATMDGARALASPRVRTRTVTVGRITHRMPVGRLVQAFGRPNYSRERPERGTGCYAYRGDDGKWIATYCIHPKARP